MRIQSVCALVASLIALTHDTGTHEPGPARETGATAQIRKGNRHLAARRYAEAIEAYRRGALIAGQEGDTGAAIKCDNNTGAASLMMMRYASAAAAFQSALERARLSGDRTSETAAQLNLVS
ncbi:MAG: hypothetical protein HY858_09430 [Candidatus Solibacter usitatus]|nr:hypothetical protein [Candidatus Solibacter usitatus]